jgi:hypothetical protein
VDALVSVLHAKGVLRRPTAGKKGGAIKRLRPTVHVEVVTLPFGSVGLRPLAQSPPMSVVAVLRPEPCRLIGRVRPAYPAVPPTLPKSIEMARREFESKVAGQVCAKEMEIRSG